jgi:hypothetical protein
MEWRVSRELNQWNTPVATTFTEEKPEVSRRLVRTISY